MLDMLKKIYEEKKYNLEKVKEKIFFANQPNKEYFFISKYEEEELLNFYECEKTKIIIEQFQQYKDDKKDVKRNTSLIICVKVNDIKKFNTENKNLIFKIEEDEYFFRKYIVVYSEKSIEKIKDSQKIIQIIEEILSQNKKLEEFMEDNYRDEEFFVAMEITIKISFLSFKNKNEQFQPIDSLLEEELKSNNLNKIFKIINEKLEIEYIEEKLKGNFLLNNEEDGEIEKFFKIFEGEI